MAGAFFRSWPPMTSADSLSLILRRLDEIERKLDRIMKELQTPTASAIRYVGAIVQDKD
jgi:tetrahydromethanopterin S-methyltransferase subunit G